MDKNNPIGQNLKRLLRERGMKAIQLAEEAGINCGQVSRILNGKCYPSVKSLNRIADVLGVTPGTLLDGKLPHPNESLDEPIIDPSIQIALRSFKKLGPEDRKQLAWVIRRFAQLKENRA